MVKGKEKILQFIRDNDSPYWTLFHYEKGNGNTFISRIEDETISLDNSIERLSRYLDLIEPNRYRLSAKRTFNTAKGYAETAIELLADPAAVSGVSNAVPAAGYVSADDVTRQVAAAVEAYEAKQEAKKKDERIADMEKQLREYQKGDFGQTLSRIYTRFEPFLDQVLIPELKKKINNPALSGTKNNTTMDNNSSSFTNEEEELAQLLERWEKIHPGDPLTVIRTIVEMAENNAAKYSMAKSMM